MSVFILDDSLWFPPLEEADPDGLLAVGGDLSPDRLLLAYRNGIFPWFNDDDPILWWSPDPRFVLFPAELKVSKSMKQVIRREEFEFRTDTAFAAVIKNCGAISRKGMDGTWITPHIMEAYIRLHEMGIAHSAETWLNGELVGGLYGVLLGDVFFGESMFSRRSNASKFAFIYWVERLKAMGVKLIDCQMETTHLASLGGRMISRNEFISIVRDGTG